MAKRPFRIAVNELWGFVMSGRFSERPKSPSQQLHGVSPLLFRRRQLWQQLAAYRPLWVLAGIWVGLLAIALLAYGQLLQTDPGGITVEPTAESEPYPHERLNRDGEDEIAAESTVPLHESFTAEAGEELPERDAGTTTATVATGFSIWTLVALVGSCALGCWVLSIQLKASPKPRKRKRVPTRRPAAQRLVTPSNVPPTGLRKTHSPATPPKLAPYDPQQPLVKSTKSRQPSRESPTHPVASPPEPVATNATLVSEDFQHQLDWPADSLVNTADVRQRRSLSSYL